MLVQNLRARIGMQQDKINVWVDPGACIGSGNCVSVAPRVFRLDETMKAVIIDPDGDPLESVLDAAEICPTQAIYVSEGGVQRYP
jgi:ferredoxin